VICVVRVTGPCLESIEDQSTDDEATIEAFGVNFIGVPFAEDVIGAFGDGMNVVMGAQIEAEFAESIEGEVGAIKQILGDIAEELNGCGEEWFPGAGGDTDIIDVEREGTESLVGIDFGAATIFEDGNGAVSDVDIELSEGVLDCGGRSEAADFGSSHECGFEHFCEEEGAEEFVWGDVSEEVGVMFAECGEQLIEGEADDVFGLGAL